MAHVSAVFLCFVGLLSTTHSFDIIEGHYKAWWVAINFPKESIESLIPDGFEMVTPKDWLPSGTHPIILEIGTEHDCGPTWPKSLQKTFMEFKHETPFLRYKNNNETVNYKSIIYVNDTEESVLSRDVYGLNSSDAKSVNISDELGVYNFEFKGLTFDANFTPKADWGTIKDYPTFEIYETIMNQKWFGNPSFSKCASHHYDFETAKIRPAEMTLKVSRNLLSPVFPDTVIKVPGIGISKGSVGAVQVDIHFTMSLPESCTG